MFLAPCALSGTPEFIETEDNQEGPFYKAGAPQRASLGDKLPGTPFELTGRVFNTKGVPLPGGHGLGDAEVYAKFCCLAD